MSVSGVGGGQLNMAQSQAQWDAIISIKSTSPFDQGSASSGASTVGAALDSMLSAYSADPTAGSPSGDESLAAITQRVREAQLSTIDLFA